jgi:hypothetical protein
MTTDRGQGWIRMGEMLTNNLEAVRNAPSVSARNTVPGPEPDGYACQTCKGGRGFLTTPIFSSHRGHSYKCPDCDQAWSWYARNLPWAERRKYTVENLQGPEGDAVRKWVAREVPDRPTLLLVGTGGFGKTFAATAVGFRLAQLGNNVEAFTAPDLLEAMRRPRDPELVNDPDVRARTADVLILDDLGAEQNTDQADARLYALINHRYYAERPMVVTTNTRAHSADDRIWSRLLDQNRTRTVRFRSKNWRVAGASM